MDSSIENKNFDSILQFKQDDTFLKIKTPKVVESKHEGYRINFGWDFSPKFGELIGYLAPGPSPLIAHMAPPWLPNENEVIHVFCDIVILSMIGKQRVFMLDLIPSRGVYTITTVMNRLAHVR